MNRVENGTILSKSEAAAVGAFALLIIAAIVVAMLSMVLFPSGAECGCSCAGGQP